ncbi:MAG: hypothetical protein ETSY1_29635 [Candidatus Entotheonella factor]|uniref:Uncharacterized protein n=1 Tax=Entotheonella factor TaxID=1429438 RepID=W4LD71_ENTF1|nr:hypothetical protein [Candidatus Entotheonella palauensis]ETW95670.1 MAG: hypothetical protein ETSY1_29635 [Candidatus Entotheonella factor]
MADQQPHLPEQEALQELVRRRYRHYLTTEQLEAVKREVEAVAEMLASLREVPLANHEEPFTSFIPYRRET